MPVTRYRPSIMSLAACISHWPSPTRCPWFAYWFLTEERLEHRRLHLLELEAPCNGVTSGRLVWQRPPLAPATRTVVHGQMLGSVAGPRVRCSCVGLLSIAGGACRRRLCTSWRSGSPAALARARARGPRGRRSGRWPRRWLGRGRDERPRPSPRIRSMQARVSVRKTCSSRGRVAIAWASA